MRHRSHILKPFAFASLLALVPFGIAENMAVVPNELCASEECIVKLDEYCPAQGDWGYTPKIIGVGP